jgi:hypothetical protein
MADLVTEIERQALEGVDLIEEFGQAAVNGLEAVVEPMADFLPQSPTFPFGEIIPAPRDVVRSTFAVAERTLRASRKVSDGFVVAIAPIVTRLMPWTGGPGRVARSEAKPGSQTKANQAA